METGSPVRTSRRLFDLPGSGGCNNGVFLVLLPRAHRAWGRHVLAWGGVGRCGDLVVELCHGKNRFRLCRDEAKGRPAKTRTVAHRSAERKAKGLGLDAAACNVRVDGNSTGMLKPGTYLYVDRPAGRHELLATQALFPGTPNATSRPNPVVLISSLQGPVTGPMPLPGWRWSVVWPARSPPPRQPPETRIRDPSTFFPWTKLPQDNDRGASTDGITLLVPAPLAMVPGTARNGAQSGP